MEWRAKKGWRFLPGAPDVRPGRCFAAKLASRNTCSLVTTSPLHRIPGTQYKFRAAPSAWRTARLLPALLCGTANPLTPLHCHALAVLQRGESDAAGCTAKFWVRQINAYSMYQT